MVPRSAGRSLAAYDRGEWEVAATSARARLEVLSDLRCATPRGPVRGSPAPRRSARDALCPARRPLGHEAEDFYLFGNLIARSGDATTARECWEAGFRADPNHPELLQEFARLAIQTERLTLASGFARRLAARPGWEGRGDLLLGQILTSSTTPRAPPSAAAAPSTERPSAASSRWARLAGSWPWPCSVPAGPLRRRTCYKPCRPRTSTRKPPGSRAELSCRRGPLREASAARGR